MLLSACSTVRTAAVDGCSGFKDIRPAHPVVRGSTEYQTLRRDDPLGLLDSHRDILTPSTAGQIAAHKLFYRQKCGKKN